MLDVARVAVDVLEGITPGIGDGHQFDDADIAMVGQPCRLVEGLPTTEIIFDVVGQAAQQGIDPMARQVLAEV
ncbi:hypothetical protein D3C80_2006120 [compost metagenome]